jgi:hypothetical protein
MFKMIAMTLAVVAAEKCPAPASIQSEEVKKNFNMDYFHGNFYEIAYHDYTQPIGVCGCMRSVKGFNETTQQIQDDFTLNCGSKTDNTHTHTYHNALTFDMSPVPGVWNGKWPLLPGTIFPDTLVDVGPVVNGQYAWVLELQCVEVLGAVAFIGANFYSSLKEHTYLETMKASWTKHSLDKFIYPAHGNQLTLVNQEGCLYNNTAQPWDPKYGNVKKDLLSQFLGLEKPEFELEFL